MRKPYVGADVLYRVYPQEERYEDFPYPVRPAKVVALHLDGSVELAVMVPGGAGPLSWTFQSVYNARYDPDLNGCWFWPDPDA